MRHTYKDDRHRLVAKRSTDILAEQNRLQRIILDRIATSHQQVSSVLTSGNGFGAIRGRGSHRFPSGWNRTPLSPPVAVQMHTGPTNADRRNMRLWQRNHQHVNDKISQRITQAHWQPYRTLIEVYGRHLNSASDHNITV